VENGVIMRRRLDSGAGSHDNRTKGYFETHWSVTSGAEYSAVIKADNSRHPVQSGESKENIGLLACDLKVQIFFYVYPFLSTGPLLEIYSSSPDLLHGSHNS
jgi:hypothetical protein